MPVLDFYFRLDKGLGNATLTENCRWPTYHSYSFQLILFGWAQKDVIIEKLWEERKNFLWTYKIERVKKDILGFPGKVEVFNIVKTYQLILHTRKLIRMLKKNLIIKISNVYVCVCVCVQHFEGQDRISSREASRVW